MQHEVRLPRAVVSKILASMCGRLDETGQVRIQYIHEFMGEVVSVFEPSRLWVFGSYARGAMDCGDLDVLIELNYLSGPCPPFKVAAQAIFGEVDRLSLFIGTPDKCRAVMDIKDHVLIWAGKGSAWQEAIDSIKPDPAAGRYQRDEDQIPLRAQQFLAAMDTRAFVAWGIGHGVFTSQFIPLDSLDTAAFEPGAGNQAVELTLSHCDDPDTKRLIPAIYKAIEPYAPGVSVVPSSDADFECGSMLISVGKPYLMPWHLDKESVSHLAIVPHITDRGPNGVWILSRGPEFARHQAEAKEITFF